MSTYVIKLFKTKFRSLRLEMIVGANRSHILGKKVFVKLLSWSDDDLKVELNKPTCKNPVMAVIKLVVNHNPCDSTKSHLQKFAVPKFVTTLLNDCNLNNLGLLTFH